MTPRHFAGKNGPYFIGQPFSQHIESYKNNTKKKVSIFSKIKKLLKLYK